MDALTLWQIVFPHLCSLLTCPMAHAYYSMNFVIPHEQPGCSYSAEAASYCMSNSRKSTGEAARAKPDAEEARVWVYLVAAAGKCCMFKDLCSMNSHYSNWIIRNCIQCWARQKQPLCFLTLASASGMAKMSGLGYEASKHISAELCRPSESINIQDYLFAEF